MLIRRLGHPYLPRRLSIKSGLWPFNYQKSSHLHVSSRRSLINPLLPFDVLDEAENEELEEKNKKLRKEKKNLIKRARNIKNKSNHEYLTVNDTIKADKALSAEPKPSTPIEKTDGGSSNGVGPDSGGVGGGGGSGGNNRPPSDRDKYEEEPEEFEEEPEEEQSKWKSTFEGLSKFFLKCLETIGITLSSVGILGVAGFLYHELYNMRVLAKMDEAFEKGDPAFNLSIHKRTNKHVEDEDSKDVDLSQYWVRRPQQGLIDDIVGGNIIGRYFLLIGEKGTGKTSLLLESMKSIEGYNVAMFDAHADPEIFRLRLGRALNFRFYEDYIGSLFSYRGPRDTTALLDIERAFTKLEELAVERSTRLNRPLVLIINNAHLIKENEDGGKLIELLQQKAENLSGSGLVTMVFNSDDYWVYEKLKKLGTKLELINVRDFKRDESVKALRFIREKHFPTSKYPQARLTEDLCHKIYDLIGGRPQHISQVARHLDIIKACHQIIDREKTWFMNQCGLLGSDMDDDVMESGKFSVSAMTLMREFVEMDRKRMNTLISKDKPDPKDRDKDHQLPELPLWRSRQIMTRADFIQHYDNLNIFTIDSDSRVKADSVPMMRAFHEICSQPHFDELLEDTALRVADIESLNRTREIVAKDLSLGSKYYLTKKPGDDPGYQVALAASKRQREIHGLTEDPSDSGSGDGGDDEDEDELYMEDISRSDSKKWWKKRMQRIDHSYLPPPKSDHYDIDIDRKS